jgi:hypothetical protein
MSAFVRLKALHLGCAQHRQLLGLQCLQLLTAQLSELAVGQRLHLTLGHSCQLLWLDAGDFAVDQGFENVGRQLGNLCGRQGLELVAAQALQLCFVKRTQLRIVERAYLLCGQRLQLA